MLVCGSLLRQLKKGLILTFMLSTFVSIASFSNNIHLSEEQLPKLTQIEQTLHDLKGITKVDSSREHWMKKILNIINQCPTWGFLLNYNERSTTARRNHRVSPIRPANSILDR